MCLLGSAGVQVAAKDGTYFYYTNILRCTISAFQDELCTRVPGEENAAVSVHALWPKCRGEAEEQLQHRFSFHSLGTYNVMGTKFMSSAST